MSIPESKFLLDSESLCASPVAASPEFLNATSEGDGTNSKGEHAFNTTSQSSRVPFSILNTFNTQKVQFTQSPNQ